MKYSILSLKFWKIFLWLTADSNYDLFFHYILWICSYIVTHQIQGKSHFFISFLFEIILFVSKYYETLISFCTFINLKRKKIFLKFFCFFQKWKEKLEKKGCFSDIFRFFLCKKIHDLHIIKSMVCSRSWVRMNIREDKFTTWEQLFWKFGVKKKIFSKGCFSDTPQTT